MLQTILGAGGAIGNALALALTTYNTNVRLVSRTPEKVTGNEELFPADLLQLTAVEKAVTGSDVVYLTAGLPYKLSVWQAQWPAIISNVIAACKRHNSKLVFFDNNYLYATSEIGHQTEGSKIAPPSKKGAVRAALVKQLQTAMTEGLPAVIVRAADFYGPGISNSMLLETVYKNLKKRKKAMLMGPAAVKHNYTYTPDAGAATALVGNTTDAYNQTWHLPSSAPLANEQWVQLFAEALGVAPKHSTMPGFILQAGSLFSPFLKELPEMLYQYRQDYFFDSTKFAHSFPDFKPTTPEEAVKAIVAAG